MAWWPWAAPCDFRKTAKVRKPTASSGQPRPTPRLDESATSPRSARRSSAIASGRRSRSRLRMPRTGSASSALTEAAAATRIGELRAWMAQHGVDAAYVTRPVSIAYLSGVRAEPYERLMALAVKDDRATLICPALERENAERADIDAEIASWSDGEDPYRLVRQALRGSGRGGGGEDHPTPAAPAQRRAPLYLHGKW